MKHWITAALVAAAATAANVARAEDAVEEGGFYFGGGVGEFGIEIDDFDDTTTTIENYDTDDTAYKLMAGYRANKFIGMEVAYVNLGNPEDEILPGAFAEVETDGFAPYVVGTLPFGPFEAFAKAGYYFYDVNSRVRSPLGVSRASESGEDFTWSAGLGLTLAKTFNLRLEYEQFDIEEADNANALWLNASFRF